jgi:hypothetical protein
MKRVWTGVILAFLMAGCGTLPSFGTGEKEFSLTGIDTNLQRQLPISRKTPYGTVRVLGVALQPAAKEEALDVMAKFVLISYEIPEGIEGVVRYSATLRYDPATRSLRLGTLQAKNLRFANSSLEEYVSARAHQGIPGVVASVLEGMTLQRMPDGFRARKVESFNIKTDKLFVDFD